MDLKAEDIQHFPGCSADYPEKVPGEAAQATQLISLSDGYSLLNCVDCGAWVTDLPPLEDPYWDDLREELSL